ncbi:MAG TPA: hypothetical protein VF613_18550 [Longimicrobium sp.]|jgi:hypothetical protein
MYSMIRSLTLRELLVQQLPVLALSLVIAELFYKFHSFLLESIAFLLTWGLLDFAISFARGRAEHHPGR